MGARNDDEPDRATLFVRRLNDEHPARAPGIACFRDGCIRASVGGLSRRSLAWPNLAQIA